MTPWTAACQASLSSTITQSLFKLMSIESMMPSNHRILCCHLLLLPLTFPSTGVFSKESALCIRWPKYCCFSFSISPFIEYLGLISFKIDWFDLLAVQETLQGLLQHKVWKHWFFSAQPSLWSDSHIPWRLEKPELWLYRPLWARWENWGSESGTAKIMYAELGLTTSNSVTFSYCYNLLQTGNIII